MTVTSATQQSVTPVHTVGCLPIIQQNCGTVATIAKEVGKAVITLKNSGVVQTVVKVHIEVFGQGLCLATNSAKMVGGKVIEHPFMLNMVKVSKIFPLALSPLALYSVGNETVNIAKGHNRVDSALKLSEGLASLSDAVYAGIESVNIFGEAGMAALKVAFSFSVASTFLWIATVAINYKHRKESLKFLDELQTSMGGEKTHYEINDYFSAMTKIHSLSDYEIKKHFAVSGPEIKDLIGRVTLVASQQFQNDPDQARSTMRKAVRTLQGRVTNKIETHERTILSAKIGIIAMIILLFIPPLAPLGYFMLATSAIISIVKTVQEYRTEKLFKKTMQQIIETARTQIQDQGYIQLNNA